MSRSYHGCCCGVHSRKESKMCNPCEAFPLSKAYVCGQMRGQKKIIVISVRLFLYVMHVCADRFGDRRKFRQYLCDFLFKPGMRLLTGAGTKRNKGIPCETFPLSNACVC
jgi:hypothetical protein